MAMGSRDGAYHLGSAICRRGHVETDYLRPSPSGPVRQSGSGVAQNCPKCGGGVSVGWWSRISAYSLGWVSARDLDGTLVGFVNVAWDGGDHAFLIDTKTRGTHQRQGIGRELVRQAVINSRAAGCEWLHVDFRPEHAPFYLDACGFRPTDAGLIHLDGGLPE